VFQNIYFLHFDTENNMTGSTASYRTGHVQQKELSNMQPEIGAKDVSRGAQIFQKSTSQNSDMNTVPYRGPTDIRRHRTNLCSYETWRLGFVQLTPTPTPTTTTTNNRKRSSKFETPHGWHEVNVFPHDIHIRRRRTYRGTYPGLLHLCY
jgi:hypothetical protein